MSQFFTSGGQSIGVLASASVFPVNIQDWFPLGLTGLISLQSKGLSGVFSNTIVQKHQFFGTQFFYSPTLTSIHDHGKTIALIRPLSAKYCLCFLICCLGWFTHSWIVHYESHDNELEGSHFNEWISPWCNASGSDESMLMTKNWGFF